MKSPVTHLESLQRVKALTSPVRQVIWNLVLILKPVPPKTLQDHLGLERHALYYHLKILEACGLIEKMEVDGQSPTYTTRIEDITVDQGEDPEWKEVRRNIALTALRRLTSRVDSALMAEKSGDPRRYLSGVMTLFLNEEGRNRLRDRLDQLWEDLEEFQQIPIAGEKPHLFAFGFAPESYGQDA